ncbi:asparagine synthase (glutamine-hydrolyzing) [Marinomonas posidonica]|uniref:asparagine synthase (glutamine-hydrolyzing) n=1 Tax=Marinomonas posidonica TaxID=936476 RepID=UPI003735CA9F
MCGIVGFLGKYTSPDIDLSNMVNAIRHRGPDDQGIWFDQSAGIGLAHARLSIVDLSPAGHQPMESSSERYVLVFNGEIYNHHLLRAELETCGFNFWRGHSDTETLLAAIELWGLEATLKKSKGMFAIALWDKQSGTLSLARDRMGEKPLYYGWVNGNFVFSSELKALKTLPKFNNSISHDALALYLRYNAIPAPYSIYENLYKLEPGSIASVQLGDDSVKKSIYWSTVEVQRSGMKSPFSGTENDAVVRLEKTLKSAVALQMSADVPLGAFLSGGVDSSAIVALMQAQSMKKIKTFSIGFDDKAYNEAEHARAVAQHLGTEHYDMYVSGQDALDVIPKLPYIYDEPFADSSQIPTYLVSQIAKKKVTVSLSGDAGDELFGGYNRYTMTNNIWKYLSPIPVPLRKLVSSGIQSVSPEHWSKLLNIINPSNKPQIKIGDKLHKGARVLSSKNVDELYDRLISGIDEPEEWLKNKKKVILDKVDLSFLKTIESMMARDMVGYLPTDILTKVDRAAMAVSLETRVPFLDPSVIELAASFPLEYKIRDGVGKWVLREVLYKHVPEELIERPKMGFGVPLAEWLRGPLKDWAENLLDKNRLHDQGFFDVSVVHRKWQEHVSGKRNWQTQLWAVLIFQAWLDSEN